MLAQHRVFAGIAHSADKLKIGYLMTGSRRRLLDHVDECLDPHPLEYKEILEIDYSLDRSLFPPVCTQGLSEIRAKDTVFHNEGVRSANAQDAETQLCKHAVDIELSTRR